MKRPLLFLLLIGLVLILSVFFLRDKIKEDFSASLPYPTSAPTSTIVPASGKREQTLSVFVPYWAVSSTVDDEESYESFIFFWCRNEYFRN